ncbi:MAG TPA: diguanylate cyclase [Burkholderiales bacterium]|nr:diguanylate cyclase [Burkholderiales bacterium]
MSRATDLLEANEQLVLATLHAEADADAAKLALDELARSVGLDALTQVPTRVLLLDRFAQAISNAKRHDACVAVLFLDLDDFKVINDTLGHAVGDQVLQWAAQCILSSIREADTVSRYGGDEFVILLTEVAHEADALVVVEKLSAALGSPIRIADRVLRLAASIGISFYPGDGEEAATLIDRADAAMYRAKRGGPGGFALYRDALAHDRLLTTAAWTAVHRSACWEKARAEHEHHNALLQEANEQLVLAALTAQELQYAAEEARREQDRFLAVLAHELRHPLTPIRTAAELLGRVRAEDVPRVQAIIERQVAYMTRLVGDLLDVERSRTGKLRLERRAVDMTQIIDAAVTACRHFIAERLQLLDLHVPPGPLPVHGDPVRLEQVIRNLLDNASKYTPKGGTIHLSVLIVGDTFVMTVSDTGIGITAEALPHVFDPFVQDRHAIVFNGAGLGIGLTVVRQLVQAHGGNIVAHSAGSGLGSQFVVTLPLSGNRSLTQGDDGLGLSSEGATAVGSQDA